MIKMEECTTCGKRMPDASYLRHLPCEFRTHDRGRQIVRVDGDYAYTWDGPDLQIGDRVLVPGNWFSEIKQGPGPFEATVHAFGTDYTGPLSRILKVLAK